MQSSSLLRSGLIALALCFTAQAAADTLGTAGPIRRMGGGKCDAKYPARMNGACDPPPVADDLLPLDQRSKARVNRARELFSLLRIEQAIEELNRALADDPSDTSTLILLGRYHAGGNGSLARELINRALQIDASNSDALATRAYLTTGDNAGAALQDVTKALEKDPANADARWIRSRILVRMDRYEEAERDLSVAVSMNPDDQLMLTSRAYARLKMDKQADAEADATAALAISRNFNASYLRGMIRGNAGDYPGAIADLGDALLEAGPVAGPGARQIVNAHILRALALVRMNKPDEARADIDSLVVDGGKRAILQMQLYLRGHGFPDVQLNGKRTNELDEALRACFINDGCGRGLTQRG
jgi:tetratricopeptide (TPR) repeat protein